MKVVILCGGQGTRLREETEFRPKPLVEIGGRPILWHIMKLYAHHGFNDFILCLGYKGNQIKEYFLNYEAMNNDFSMCIGQRESDVYVGQPHIMFTKNYKRDEFHVTLVDTGLDTMTGGRLLRVKPYLHPEEAFMVTYGDGLADVDLNSLVRFHQNHVGMATVTVFPHRSRFGVVDMQRNGHVKRFSEKPETDAWASAGFFVFEPAVLNYIEGDQTLLEREPLEKLAQEDQLMAYGHAGFYQAMDTYRETQLLNELWASGKAPWKVW